MLDFWGLYPIIFVVKEKNTNAPVFVFADFVGLLSHFEKSLDETSLKVTVIYLEQANLSLWKSPEDDIFQEKRAGLQERDFFCGGK